ALVRAAQNIENEVEVENEDQKLGVKIIAKACTAPLKQIAYNAGYEGGMVLAKVIELGRDNPNMGFNAATGEYVDMLQAGIIDPTKVERTALENAVSASGVLLTAEAIVANIPEKKEGKGGSDMDMPEF
ncbi:MAG: molecular chaperone GroEL, partial [Aquificaceae bacterium]